MDLGADRVLQRELGISHRRAVALLTIEKAGPLSQRALAALLGHTEPAVSTLVRDLARQGAVSLEAVDGRQRRVAVTAEGARLVAAARQITKPMFEAVVISAGVDAEVLGEQLSLLAHGLGIER